MGVGFEVDGITTEVGTEEFFHAFCSTVSYCLEPEGWGSRFPEILESLYAGSLPVDGAQKALESLSSIRSELKNFPPDRVVWDINDLTARPPWGAEISSHISSLSNYFVTSTGGDLIDVMERCIRFQIAENSDMKLVRTPAFPGKTGAFNVTTKPT